MRIVGIYSFNQGREYIERYYAPLLREVMTIIQRVDAGLAKTKVSKEITMQGRQLYSPQDLNEAFKTRFFASGWESRRVRCDYPTQYYVEGYQPIPSAKKPAPFREMDFIKDQLGVEVQLGKYAFMVYNVCAKMTIFRNLGHIKAGVEVVPIKEFADEMSTGVSYFEQFVWDLEQRGVSNIDIPVLILGVKE